MKKIGNYVLEEELSRGSSGVVYKASDSSGALFAIKKIELNQRSTEIIKYLNNEIKLISSLSHPNIIKIYQVLKSVNNTYMVMEYCEGGDLATFLEFYQSVPLHLVIPWVKDLIKTLQNLKEKKIIHRDIKPANLLLSSLNLEDAKIKLSDFGFSSRLSNSLASTQVGTPLYMAPELFSSENYSYKADIWSLGVTVYELIYGKRPFECFRIQELKLLQKNLIFPDDNGKVSQYAKDFIKALLTYDCVSRPGYEEILQMDFLNEERLLIESRILENSIVRIVSLGQLSLDRKSVNQNEIPQNYIRDTVMRYEKKHEELGEIFRLKQLYDDNLEVKYLILAFLDKIIVIMICEIESLKNCLDLEGFLRYYSGRFMNESEAVTAELRETQRVLNMRFGENFNEEVIRQTNNELVRLNEENEDPARHKCKKIESIALDRYPDFYQFTSYL